MCFVFGNRGFNQLAKVVKGQPFVNEQRQLPKRGPTGQLQLCRQPRFLQPVVRKSIAVIQPAFSNGANNGWLMKTGSFGVPFMEEGGHAFLIEWVGGVVRVHTGRGSDINVRFGA